MDYWKKRQLIERTRLFDLTEAELRKLLKKEYLRVYKEIQAALNELILSLPANATANDLYKEDKFYKLLNEIQYKLDNLGNLEKDKMTETFEKFYVNNQQLESETTTNIKIDDERVFNAINAVWAGDGKNFSDRIWTNKRQMIEKLKTGLINTVTTGANWGELSKELKNMFGTSYSQARRLVRTELSHIQVKSTLDKYEADGIKKVKFIAENDCCDECRQHNGKVYDVNNAPKIPCHPNCRCTYLAVIEGE